MHWRALPAAVLAGLLLAPAPRAGQVRAQPNLILISLDTTRADALSCYGTVPGIERELPQVTPHIDALAARGTRFTAAYAHAPTTLSSHTSMLSGLDPHRHAVVRNGFPLPDDVRTLPERLSAAGYDTIGVVAAAALDSDMGIDRGFRVYDDDLKDQFGPMVQDRAERVVERARAALETRQPDKPLFLFAHFYDPHAPYGAPGEAQHRFVDPAYEGPLREESYQVREHKQALLDGEADAAAIDAMASLYLGEVAYVDTHVGALLEHLEAEGLLEHSIVVLTADHGEMLHEKAQLAYSHGHDVYDATTRVPLLVAGQGVPLPVGRVVDRQVGLAGLAPTLEVLLGLAPSLGDKRDFAEMLALGPVRGAVGWPARPVYTVFAEATRSAEDHPEWNNLHLMRSVRAGGHTGYRWPSRLDRFEVVGPADALAPELEAMLATWDAAAPPHREDVMSDATRDALEALGYLTGED